MKRDRKPKALEQALPATGSVTNCDGRKSAQEHSRDQEKASSEETEHGQLSLEEALNCLEKSSASLKKEALQRLLETVERIAQERGLAPEEIDTLLNIIFSGHFGHRIHIRLLKSLIPISVIKEDSVVSAVSWLCSDTCSYNIQVVILKWLIVMFDFIDQKENINALYGFFFSFLQYEKLHPYACHVLYLLTRMENVKPFRVRKLLGLYDSMGAEPALQTLLWKYKSFAPKLVTITLPTKTKISFKKFPHPWKTAIDNTNLRIHGTPYASHLTLKDMEYPRSLKRKRNETLVSPVCSSNAERLAGSQKPNHADLTNPAEFFPVKQLQIFPQLLQNIHYLKPPSQIGSVIGNPLLLHYFNCLKDNSVFWRMYYWMNHTLKKECPWYKTVNQQDELKFRNFLEEVFKAECFLQRGFFACEEFLWRSLGRWDGCCCQSQVLQLVRWISPNSISEMKKYLYRPLLQLFSTSSLYFKCHVLESLRELLLNWLNCHMQADVARESNAGVLNTIQFDLKSSLAELIQFVNRLSTVALCLENNSTFLMHTILDFYEIVCDIYQKYNLPLIVMLPAGVLYPAFLSMDSATLDQLCYIMYRYRINLHASKQNRHTTKFLQFSRQICQEYNQYLTIVAHLWISPAPQNSPCPQVFLLDPEMLEIARVEDYRKGLNIVYHPALMGYAMLFLQKLQPEDTTPNYKLIRGRTWDWYHEFLYSQELQGLKLFFKSSIRHVSKV